MPGKSLQLLLDQGLPPDAANILRATASPVYTLVNSACPLPGTRKYSSGRAFETMQS